MEGEKIKLFVRQSSGDQFDVEVDAKISIADLKLACEEKQGGMKAGEMRLIFKGKILKDEMTIEDFKITDGLTIHLVKGKTAAGGGGAAAATTTLPTESSDSTGATSAPLNTGA